MKLQMTTNLGRLDASRLGLEAVVEGDFVEVEGDVAEELLKRGWATHPPKADKADKPAPAAPPAAPHPADFGSPPKGVDKDKK